MPNDTNADLAGRCDALALAIAVILVEVGSLRGFAMGTPALQGRDDMLRKIEQHLPGLLGTLEQSGQPERARGFERQVELMAKIVREAARSVQKPS
jgi:hypothetical protein